MDFDLANLPANFIENPYPHYEVEDPLASLQST